MKPTTRRAHRRSPRAFRTAVSIGGIFLACLPFQNREGRVWAQCLPLSVTAAAPASGVSGDPVTISGEGFCAPADGLFAWVWDGSTGFPFLTLQATDTALDVEVGTTAALITGAIEVWKGRRNHLPDVVHSGSGGIFLAEATEIFLASEFTSGASFSALARRAGGCGSHLIADVLRLELLPTSTGGGSPGSIAAPLLQPIDWCGCDHIVVDTIVRTNGEPGEGELERNREPGTGQAASASSVEWGAFFTIRRFGDPALCPGTFVQDVAALVGRRLAPLDMQAQAVGTAVELRHVSAAIEAGLLQFRCVARRHDPAGDLTVIHGAAAEGGEALTQR